MWKSTIVVLFIPVSGELNLYSTICGNSINKTDMKFNQHTLDQLESILEEAGYVVRYERGNFQSGYCVLEEKKVVVLNKFLSLEGRIQTVLDLLPQVQINIDLLTDQAQRLYMEVLSMAAAKEAAAAAA